MSLDQSHPARRHRLVMSPMPTKSTAGIPLANGLLGACVWADGTDLLISLDRADLWDLRAVPEFSGEDYTVDRLADLVAAGELSAIAARFEAPYRRPAPTKLPAGRFRLRGAASGDGASLALDRAMAEIQSDIAQLTTFVCAHKPVGVFEGRWDPAGFTIEPPAFGDPDRPRPRQVLPISPGAPQDLDYPPPQLLADAIGYVQHLPDGSGFCVRAEQRMSEGRQRALWTIAIAQTPDVATAEARAVLQAAWDEDGAFIRAAHAAWWAQEWARVSVALPDPVLEQQWTLDAYKFIAAARADCPPVALQGPWTSDDGLLPPWKGDYHHDLNTQMTYWPSLTGNRHDAHRGFLDWLWDTRTVCEAWTKQFFGVDGLNVPMTADIHNRQLGGWAPYTHMATTGAWLAQHFLDHWRYTRDADFLRTRAFPYVRACAVFLEELTRKQARNGVRALRLSSSPEINNNAREAWFDGWTNYDLALAQAVTDGAAELAAACGDEAETQHWRAVRRSFPDLARDADGGLAIAPGVSLEESHRHFSHLLALHPLRTLAPSDRGFSASLARLERLGPRRWMGYSFAWLACLYALAGRGDAAVEQLHVFARSFTGANSFHTNGEVGAEQLTDFPFHAFTLEGNCAAMAAIQDMLVQSKGEAIELFAAIPPGWTQVSFSGLCAEGAVTIDAKRAGAEVIATFSAKNPWRCRVRIARRGPWRDLLLEPGRPMQVAWPWPQ